MLTINLISKLNRTIIILKTAQNSLKTLSSSKNTFFMLENKKFQTLNGWETEIFNYQMHRLPQLGSCQTKRISDVQW